MKQFLLWLGAATLSLLVSYWGWESAPYTFLTKGLREVDPRLSFYFVAMTTIVPMISLCACAGAGMAMLIGLFKENQERAEKWIFLTLWSNPIGGFILAGVPLGLLGCTLAKVIEFVCRKKYRQEVLAKIKRQPKPAV